MTAVQREVHPPSFLRSVAHVLTGASISQVLVGLAFVIIARSFGPAVFGLLAAALGAAALSQDLFDFGTSQFLAREETAGRLSASDVRLIHRRRTLLTSAVAIVVSLSALVLQLRPGLTVAVACYVVAAVANAGAHGRMRAAGRFKRSATHKIGERLFWVASTLLIAWLKPHDDAAAALLVASSGLALALSAVVLPRPGNVRDSSRAPRTRLHVVYARAAGFGVQGLSSDLQQLDATLVASLGSVVAAASVGVASKLTGPVLVIGGVVAEVAFRAVSLGGQEAVRGARTAMKMTLLLSTGLLVFAPFLPTLAVALLGSAYAGAAWPIVVYSMAAALGLFNQTSAAMLAAHRLDRLVSYVIVVAVTVGLILGALLVPDHGAVGMAIGFAVTQLITLSGLGLIYLVRVRVRVGSRETLDA